MKVLVTVPCSEPFREVFAAAMPEAQFTYRPDGAGREEVHEANIILGNVAPELIKGSPNLRWIQLNSAGTDGYIQVLPQGAVLTNASGAYGLSISEYMMGMLLSLQKRLHLYRDNQNQAIWQDEGPVTSIWGAKVFILGLGDIGGEFAKRVKAFSGYTIGMRRKKLDKPEYIDEIYLMDKLDEILPQADVVALSLPSTPETVGILSEQRLFSMKKGAFVLNVGRGNAIDTDALCKALACGHLGGAGLDVTDPEPLPSDHPLWKQKNAFITPHVSGGFHMEETLRRILQICGDNLERFNRGEPLMNQVDMATGYRK